MIVQFVGEINTQAMAKKLVEVADNTIAKMEAESGVKVNGYSVHEAEIQLKVDVEGMDEPQVLAVEHDGVTEPFKWIIDSDNTEEYNNEESSVFDAWSTAKAKGVEHSFKAVESVYKDADLISYETEEFYNFKKVTWDHKEGYKVVKIYQDDKLIQEYKVTEKK